MFKNEDLSRKKSDFWFLWKPERWDNRWVFIPKQHQLARGEKELPALRRGLSALLSAFHSFSAPSWAPSVSSDRGPKEDKGVSLAAFQRSWLDIKISDSWFVLGVSILDLQRSLPKSYKKYSRILSSLVKNHYNKGASLRSQKSLLNGVILLLPAILLLLVWRAQLSPKATAVVQFSSVIQSCLTLCDPMDCKEIKPVHPKGNQSWIFIGDWCWSWNSNILATWCEELTHLKRPWCWERLKAGGEGDGRGWDGWRHHWLDGHELE